MIGKKFIIFILLMLSVLLIVPKKTVYAETLEETVNEELENLDLNELEDFFSGINVEGKGFVEVVKDFSNGNFKDNTNNFFNYLIKQLKQNLKEYSVSFFALISLSVLTFMFSNFKPDKVSESINEVINIVLLLGQVAIISPLLIKFISNFKNAIYNLVNLSTIMSPIMATLLITSNNNALASFSSPSFMLFEVLCQNVLLNIAFPLVVFLSVFGVMGNTVKEVNFSKLSSFFEWALKWILGLIVALFGIYISLKGVITSSFDSISKKALSYAISSSIPIVGGIVKDGFSLLNYGSVIIKNSLGVASLIFLIYTLAVPLISFLSFSLLIKLAGGICGFFNSNDNFFNYLSKFAMYVAVIIIISFLLFFILILIIISSSTV